MIVFYDKSSGEIIGTIGGRVLSDADLNMWVGDKESTDRIIINWHPTGAEREEEVEDEEFYSAGIDENGNEMYSKKITKRKITYREHEPQHPQKELVKEFEKNISAIYQYKIELSTMRFITRT